MTYSKIDHVAENFERLIRFDHIRVQKLMEICQYMILTMILSSYLAVQIDRFMGPYREGMTTLRLCLEIVLQFVFLTIGTYYIPKIIKVFPFFFQFGDYIPNMKKESKVGIAVALSMGFRAFQKNFKKKLNVLKTRIIG